MLLNEFHLPERLPPSVQPADSSAFTLDPNAELHSERHRFQEYCRRQLEALTAIRSEILVEEQDGLDVANLSKFQFWNKMMQKERQIHAEEVAELKLHMRRLQELLDDIQSQIYLVHSLPSYSIAHQSSTRYRQRHQTHWRG